MLAALVLAGVALTGCSLRGNGKAGLVTPTPKLVGDRTEINRGEAGDQIVGNYRIYDKQRYERAKSEGKGVLLYFYANWCPTCRVQEPIVEEVFSALVADERVVGFRVNYNDSDTTPDGKELAMQTGVTYQHTFIVLGRDGEEAWRLVGDWGKEEMISFLRGLGEGR